MDNSKNTEVQPHKIPVKGDRGTVHVDYGDLKVYKKRLNAT